MENKTDYDFLSAPSGCPDRPCPYRLLVIISLVGGSLHQHVVAYFPIPHHLILLLLLLLISGHFH